jgi:AAA family ATP:ADP antiporter
MNKTNILIQLFNIKQGEGKTVFLLFGYSFCIGISYAFLYTTATSLFLSNFETNMLPYAYMGGGLFSYALWLFYQRLEPKVSFSRLLVLGSHFLLLSLSLLALGFYFTESKWLALLLFIWINVFLFFTGVGFWGIAAKIFDLRQGKRLFGLIGSGEILSKILSFFSVPFLLKFLVTKQLLLFVVGGFFMSFCVLIIIIKSYTDRLKTEQTIANENSSPDDKPQRKGLLEILKNKYFAFIIILAIFPLFATYFVDFIFLEQTKRQFVSQELVSSFLGIFFGFMAVTEFFLKTFISGRLINKYGIFFGLVILPVILLLTTLCAAIYGSLYGITVMFFSFVVLNKLFARVLRTSFLDPSFQILYQPIPAGERLSFQGKVEGVPKSIGNVIAGATLILFASISALTVVHYYYVFTIVLLLWIWVSYHLFIEYRIALRKTIEKDDSELTILPIDEKSNLFTLCQMIESGSNENFKLIYHIIQKIEPRQVNAFLQRVFVSVRTEIQEEILLQIQDKNIVAAAKVINHYIKANPHIPNLDTYHSVLESLSKAAKVDFDKLTTLTNSENANDRYDAALLLEYSGRFNTYRLLITLLQDEDSKVRKAAILSSGKLRKTELWPYLFLNLQYDEYSSTAVSAIKAVGESILHELNNYFNKASTDKTSQLKIIHIFSVIGGEQVVEILKQKINYPDKEIKSSVLFALSKMDYRATTKELNYIREAIADEIAICVWITAALIDIENHKKSAFLSEALNVEFEQKKNNVMLFLSLLYDSKIIKRVIDAFNSKTHESRVFATEILDMTVSQEIKELFLPLLDDLSNEERLKLYSENFPQQRLSVNKRLIDIVNVNNARINRWIKTCAISALDNSSDSKIILLANIVNPDPFLMETSVSMLSETESDKIHNLIHKLKPRL